MIAGIAFFLFTLLGAAALTSLAATTARSLDLPKLCGSRTTSARWARWRDLRPLRVRRAKDHRLTLARHHGSLLAAEPLQSAIVIAPTQSGKTTGLAIPALLEWQGPVLATSIKTDLLRDTIERRRAIGEAMVFDPTGATGFDAVRATPLWGCRSWHGARRVANWLSASADTRRGLENADFWHSAAEKLLAPLLFAAASSGHRMADVVRWLDRGPDAEPEVTDLLKLTGEDRALDAWRASWNRDERQRSPICTTAETILAAFGDPQVQEASSSAEYTPARLLEGESNTLFLCSPAHEQERLRPLFSMMVREILAAAYEASARRGKPISPPLLIVLDEAANIAPIPNLDEIASSGAGQGIQLLSVFQDFAQIRKRYGPDRAPTIVNNHRAKLFGSGISDPETLEYVCRVAGATEIRERSQTTESGRRRTTTEGTAFRDLVPPNLLRESGPGSALLLYGHLPPARVSLRPWHADRRLRVLAGQNVAGGETQGLAV